MATGRLTLVTDAMAREILVNDEGKAAGVSYIDKSTRATSKCAPKPWWWRGVRVNPRACC